MEDKITNNIWAIILAAGKGTRMKSSDKNKVVLEVGGVPMLKRTIDNLREASIQNIMIVVGFAKDSVLQVLDKDIKIAYQKKRLGTGHAVKVALDAIPKSDTVLVLQGDDSYMYTPEILKELYTVHTQHKAALTFLTLMVDNPSGLGRIVRGKDGKVVGIVEEKDATAEQRKIKEINPACYMFSYDFLKKNIKKIKKSPVTKEYYLTRLIHLAVEQKEIIETFTADNIAWRGVNTPEELQEAQKLIQK